MTSAGSRNRYQPDVVSPPGDTLAEVLEAVDMAQAELAERMGRPKKTINEIVRGKAELTPETALQLERVLAISAEFWLGLERNYRAFLARQAEEEKLQAFTDWIKSFPTREMIALGWLKPVRGETALIRELLSFFGAATPKACDDINAGMMPAFRRSLRVEASAGAIAAWLRRGELEAREMACGAFDRDVFLGCLPRLRELTEADPDVIVERTKAICSVAGVAVVFVPGTKRMTASGATRWLSRDKACIQLSLRHKTDDHLWFTFFHEAAHVVLHRGLGFLDWEDSGSDTAVREDEANRFARDQLIPPDALEAFLSAHAEHLTRELVRRFAHSIGIAPGIVVGRLQHDKVLHHSEFLDLKQWFDWNSPEESNE